MVIEKVSSDSTCNLQDQSPQIIKKKKSKKKIKFADPIFEI